MFSRLHKYQGQLSDTEIAKASASSTIATRLYNEFYNNELFVAATIGKSNVYTNALIDDALATCGDPFYVLTYRHYCQAARAFLLPFELRLKNDCFSSFCKNAKA